MSANKTESKDVKLTGSDRIVANVLFSWIGYIAIIISGFILPRMMDRHVGQVALGIWDLSWSLVSYLNFAMLGLGSSCNRYVAKYRANDDIEGLRATVSSVQLLQLGIAVVVFLLTIGLTWFVPYLMSSSQDSSNLGLIKWVIACLGTSIAVQIGFDVYKGVITGCHRWDIYNGVMAISHATCAGLMFIALLMGGDLRILGVIYLINVLVSEYVKKVISYRICPELKIEWKYFSWSQAKELLVFGGKTFINGAPQLILSYTVNVMVASSMGPALLAVFSRPLAISRHLQSFMTRHSFVITPTAGALQAVGNDAELRQIFISSCRFGIAATMPVITLFVFFGDVIMHFWMGPQYARGAIIAIIMAGSLLPVSQNSAMRVLIGINKHGRIGIISLLSSVTIFLIGLSIINLTGWSLEKAALLVAIPITIGSGIIVPIYACQELKVSISEYCHEVFFHPVIGGILFGGSLWSSRMIFQPNPLAALLPGILCGLTVLGIYYWIYLIPEKYRIMVKNKLIAAKAVSGISNE